MLADAKFLRDRHQRGLADRQGLEYLWRDAFDLTYPIRGARWSTGILNASSKGQTEASYAQQANAERLDGTAADGVRILASAFKDGGMPAATRWFKLHVEGADGEGQAWLDKAADILWKKIHSSNFDAVVFECLVDLVIGGQYVLYIDDKPNTGLTFEQWQTADCTWCSTVAGGEIDCVTREYSLSAEQAVNEYGDKASTKVRDLAVQNPAAVVKFIWCIYPRDGQPGRTADRMPFASVKFEEADNHIVSESGYMEFPCVIPRWMVLPDSQYAIGPIDPLLPDIRELNKLVDINNQGLEVHAGTGTYKAVEDGVFNPRTVRLANRKVVIVGDINNLVPLAQAGDLKSTLLDIDRLQRAIRRGLMADALEPQDGPQRTATEVQIRMDLIRQQLGPQYGRMQAENDSKIVARGYALASRGQAFPPMPASLRDREYEVRFQSPQARAQKLADVSALDRYLMGLSVEVALDPDVALNINLPKANRGRAERLGLPLEWMHTEAEVVELKTQRAKARAQQEAEQAAHQAAAATDQGQPMTAAANAASMSGRAQQLRAG